MPRSNEPPTNKEMETSMPSVSVEAVLSILEAAEVRTTVCDAVLSIIEDDEEAQAQRIVELEGRITEMRNSVYWSDGVIKELEAKLKATTAVVAAVMGPGVDDKERHIKWLRDWSQALSPRDDIGPASADDHIMAEYLWRIADALAALDKGESEKLEDCICGGKARHCNRPEVGVECTNCPATARDAKTWNICATGRRAELEKGK